MRTPSYVAALVGVILAIQGFTCMLWNNQADAQGVLCNPRFQRCP
jgi:hypothetical protein